VFTQGGVESETGNHLPPRNIEITEDSVASQLTVDVDAYGTSQQLITVT
jgi:hypothetical protein